MYFPPTPVEPFRFGGRAFYVKRDDLSHPLLSGNKYRKLHALLRTPSEKIDGIVSYGGIQSNAMLAIAALCRMKAWRFDYIAKRVPSHLKAAPKGNYRTALELGMHLGEIHPLEYETAVASLLETRGRRSGSVVVPQGGADAAARDGVRILADEIRVWRNGAGIGKLTVATPAGTGTTAAFLADVLKECEVVTVAAVGDAAYLREQIEKLMPFPRNLTILPTAKHYRFATPHPDLLRIYKRLEAAGIVFDLVYAPVMWTALLENAEVLQGEVLYVHSGGISGNATMLERYERLR